MRIENALPGQNGLKKTKLFCHQQKFEEDNNILQTESICFFGGFGNIARKGLQTWPTVPDHKTFIKFAIF